MVGKGKGANGGGAPGEEEDEAPSRAGRSEVQLGVQGLAAVRPGFLLLRGMG